MTGRKKGVLCLQAVMLAGMAVSTAYLGFTWVEYKYARQEYEDLKMVSESPLSLPLSSTSSSTLSLAPSSTPFSALSEEQTDALSEERNEAALLQINPQYTGWIKIPETVVDYPIVHGPDNSYYLEHSFTNREDRVGCIFLDHGNQGMEDSHIVIHGHNRRDGSMFAVLKNYLDQSFCDAHPVIWIYVKGRWQFYDIISCYLAEEGGKLIYQSDDGSSAQLLTLSTCYGEEKRMIVQAVRMCYTESQNGS